MKPILIAMTVLATTTPPLPADDLSRPAKLLMSPAGLITSDDYPPAAIRARAQGTAGVQFRVLPNGRVGVCDVDRSTGSDLLDAMSCALIKARARYSPELDDRGRAVESATKTLRFTWRMPEPDVRAEAAQTFGTPFQFQFVVDADASGKIQECHVPVRTGPVPAPPGDPCLPILEQAALPISLNAADKAIPTRLTFSMSLTRQPR